MYALGIHELFSGEHFIDGERFDQLNQAADEAARLMRASAAGEGDPLAAIETIRIDDGVMTLVSVTQYNEKAHLVTRIPRGNEVVGMVQKADQRQP